MLSTLCLAYVLLVSNITERFYLDFFSTVLNASWIRKQSLTIFHLSAWAVTMNVCWNCLPGLFETRNMPDTIINRVFWFDTASSITGCESSVVTVCSVVGRSWKNFCMFSFPVVPLPFQIAIALSKYSRDICYFDGDMKWWNYLFLSQNGKWKLDIESDDSDRKPQINLHVAFYRCSRNIIW